MSDSVWPDRQQPTRLPSQGFFRQEHWSGLPFPSPVHESEKWKWSHTVVSESSRPCGPHGPPPQSMGFPRQEYWNGLPLPSRELTHIYPIKSLTGYYKNQFATRKYFCLQMPKQNNSLLFEYHLQMESLFTRKLYHAKIALSSICFT